jgi:ADP-ribosylglycohydrolase
MKTTSTFQEERAVGSLLAAAVGDALGWPFEGRARKSQSDAKADSARQPAELQRWTRSGSRSQPYREPIGAGDYSDDTQLLLSTARSVLRGKDWWEHFAYIELPFWLTYERGGGGATKRASQAWLAGKAPWESKQHRSKYFEAGGNGVAMRILPHVIGAGSSKDACTVAKEIVANGLCTHGHPRALVGALLHGMTLWLSLRQDEMLEFGALTRAVYEGFPEWAKLNDIPNQWQQSLSDREFRDYQKLWANTVGESMALIEIAEDALRLGPLSAGPEILHKMGALNPKTNGSGTITAAASLFLASRYAASPLQCVQVAATAVGADTDTLASMCGSILGAIHGDEWLGHFATSVQDSRYIRKIAEILVNDREPAIPRTAARVTKKDSSNFEGRLGVMEVGFEICLPDGRQSVLRQIEPMFSESAHADLCIFETEDGQTLPVKRIVKRRRVIQTPTQYPPDEILRVGIKVFVSDLVVAREFYAGKLRLPVAKQYSSGFTVAEVISVHLVTSEQRDLSFNSTSLPAPTPCIRVRNVDCLAARLSSEGIVVNAVSGHRSIKAFTILDPFGNMLEFFEAS